MHSLALCWVHATSRIASAGFSALDKRRVSHGGAAIPHPFTTTPAMSFIQLAGGPRIEIPGGKPVSCPLVAGNVPHCAPDRAAFIVQGKAHEKGGSTSNFRVLQAHSATVKVTHNRRKTASAVEITGSGPVVFEAKAYASNAEFKRFRWESGKFTVITTAP